MFFCHILNIVAKSYGRFLYFAGFENIGLMIKLDHR